MFKRILKFLLAPFLGKRRFQRFFRSLYLLGLKGMNISSSSDVRGSGEQWVLKFMTKTIKSEGQGPLVVFDVGANKGDYSKLVYSELTRCSRPFVIYAFEPARSSFTLLQKTLGGFKNVILQNLALGEKSEKAVLFSNEPNSGLASLHQRQLKHLGLNFDLQEEVQVIVLDDFCRQHSIRRIHFLKIDVEGHELSILKGAKEMLGRGVIDFIQFEFGGTQIDSRVFFRDFFNLLSGRFYIYRILKDGLCLLPKYSESEEIFLTANFLAVKKIDYA